MALSNCGRCGLDRGSTTSKPTGARYSARRGASIMNHMDTPTGKDVVPTDAPQLPALKKPNKQFKVFQELVQKIDYVSLWYDDLNNYEREMYRRREQGDDDGIPELRDRASLI
jgi:hypothetical protein